MYQLELLSEKGKRKRNLVIFVHGLTAGGNTWIRKDNQYSIYDYLYANPTIRKHYDFAMFSYFTNFSDLLNKISYIFRSLYQRSNSQIHRNLGINETANIFFSEIETHNYENIVIIGHSLGGLISKSVILKLIQRNNTEKKIRVSLYISLAVPHEGANLALWGMLLFKNRQISYLAPLNKERHSINKDWIRADHSKLPKTVYFKGNNDWVVSTASAEPYEVREVDIVDTADDHFSIVTPKSKDYITVKRIKNELKENLNIKELDADEDLPSLQNKPQFRVVPIIISLLIIILLFVFFVIKYNEPAPLVPPKNEKVEITQRLGLRAIIRLKKMANSYRFGEYFLPENKKPIDIKQSTLPGFIDDNIGTEIMVDSLDLINIFYILPNKDKNFCKVMFDLKSKKSLDYSAFVIEVKEEYGKTLYDRTINGNNWITNPNKPEQAFSKSLEDTILLNIPVNILK